MEKINELYKRNKKEIKKKLNSFKTLSEKERFQEFQFCLLTPQSNAQRCWLAIQELSKTNNPDEPQIKNILKSKTRFHNTKAKRILKSKDSWNNIKNSLKNQEIKELRNNLAKNVNGYGLKESSHFLRNIGLSNNQIAILDRHILKNLKENNIIPDTKIKSPKHYLEIEQAFLKFAESINIPADHLDLIFWQKENGEIFK